ncbi:hypothetical protein KY084_08540 [Stakelama sp. CBK3Z-3]|uniref:Uncharacterized protein n=1 Tax=Stakelama flava TaxID=2860338 RepID=A0ABS6XL37_9SPHN|nr:hypothetical protein [Stakelama flava]MBW4330922.1 hypothetical protein [Stakelama flava]
MNDMPDTDAASPKDPEPPKIRAEREESERQEKARRRRLLTLAEILGIVALIISAATLWNNVTMRRSQEQARETDQAETAKQQRAAAHEAALVSLDGTPRDGGRTLLLSDRADHSIQSARIIFPPALGIAGQDTLLEPKIESGWFADKLLALTDGGPDRIQGRLPVEIAASYWAGDAHRTDRAIYDIVFTTEGQVLRGRKLKLKGIVLRQRMSGDAGARLDRLWATERERLQALKD